MTVIGKPFIPMQLCKVINNDMKLYLSSTSKIKDIKRQFAKEFPYVRIEFQRKYMAENVLFDDEIQLSGNSPIKVPCLVGQNEIAIPGNHTMAEIGRIFQSKFDLCVQFFRKTSWGWIEVNQANQFTLARMNRMGREACNAMYDEEVLL